jgi:hypothetical protein
MKGMLDTTRELSGKTILLHIDQGRGDMIQFVRYLPLLVQQEVRVVLESPRELAPLLAGIPGISIVVQGEPLPPFDCHYPLVSLPAVLGHEFGAEPPYLDVPSHKISRWRSEMKPSGLPAIGVVWAGNPMHKNDGNRSMPLRLLLPLFETAGVQFLALQKPLRDGDREILRSLTRVRLLDEQLKDFSDTAAVVSLLDLVITVDTAVAHLTGALGKPVWVLLSSCPDWRWRLDGTHTPYYPSARLFRQPRTGDWPRVVTEVRAALEQVIAGAANYCF